MAIRNGLTAIWSLLLRRYDSKRVHILEKSALASQIELFRVLQKIYEDSLVFDAVTTTTKLSLTPTAL